MAVQRVVGVAVGWLLTTALLSLLLLAGHCLGDGRDTVPALQGSSSSSGLAHKVIWAVNAGGDAHTDAHGVRYEKDPLEGSRTGVASDYGALRPIRRSAQRDQALYQTERYSENTFGYEVPVRDDGAYVLVMKFAEVYFDQPQQKVFDVRLNGRHVVVRDLDIFARAGGRSAAHDEVVPFSVADGKLHVRGGEEGTAFDGKLSVEFVKGYYDNPKVCALYVMKGSVEDVPKLPPQGGEEKDWDREDGGERRYRKRSGYRILNPYDDDDDDYLSLLFPILLALLVFVATFLFLRWL